MTLEDEYRAYLLGFLVRDFEDLIDVRAMSFEEFVSNKDKKNN